MTRRRRGLTAEEQELWGRVAASARPFRPGSASMPLAAGTPKPKSVTPTLLTPELKFGSAVRSKTMTHDLVPPLEDRLAAQPLRMDKRIHQELQRGKLRPEAKIDLHGMTLAEAHPELIRFILNAQSKGRRLVLVITGKGKRGEDHGPIPQRVGVLRHQVPHWLSQAPLGGAVMQILPAHLKHGGSGAFYVYLRRVW
ncbi:MAG: Smr/MutS family protein [Albidovulum sp.]